MTLCSIYSSAITVPWALRRDGINNFSQLTKALWQIRVSDSEPAVFAR